MGFYEDIVSTALEGGINYWAVTRHYQWVDDDGRLHVVAGRNNPVEDRQDTYAVVLDMDEPDEPLTIDAEVVERGIATIVAQAGVVRESERKAIGRAYAVKDAGNIDADLADSIVQVGLFGKLVFG